jgi:Flp pilus assembly protein TadB
VTLERALELLLGNLGVLVLLLVILFGGFRGWWTWGWYARELRERNERLEARLDRAVGAAESGTGLASRAVRQVEGLQGERPQ